MNFKTRIHDGMVGALVLTCTLFGLMQGEPWLYASGALAVQFVHRILPGLLRARPHAVLCHRRK